MAMLTAILVLMLASGLMAGMFAAVLADQRSHQTDRDQTQAYAAAHAGLEKLTSTLGLLFEGDFSPSASQLNVLDNYPPGIPGFEYTAPGGTPGSGYEISYIPDPGPGPNTGNPMPSPNNDITTGPFEGLKGLITPYTITVTARSTTGNSEVRLRREIQTVAVPVFQFGIFGEKSLGFHAGPNFDFGGRVHTNEKLFLASGSGSTLTFRDKITAFDEVVRDRLSNGISITLTNHGGNVSVPTVIGASYRNLSSSESSGTTASPWPGWANLSTNTYHANIRTEATGAKRLDLPLATQGATPVDLIKRPAVNSNENVVNKVVFDQRYFSQASVRILLSDRANDLLDLPTVTSTPPVSLDGDWNAAPPAGYVVGPGRPALARAIAPDPSLNVGAPFNTRVSSISGTTLTIQTNVPPSGTWNTGVPEWLRVANNGFDINGSLVTCTGINGSPATQLSGCGAHPAFASGATLSVTFEGITRTTTLNGSAAANSTTININSLTTGQLFRAAKTFYVGEDPVSCTYYDSTKLYGCLWGVGTLSTNDPVYSGSTLDGNNSPIGGFLKVEMQDAAGTWNDVTMELLNLGFAGPNLAGNACGDPTPNAVIRLQRLRDSGLGAGGCSGSASTNYAGSTNGLDYYPNMLFDAREGNTRLVATNADLNLQGLFSYVALDVDNFRRWVTGALGGSGSQVLNNNGYIVYFSDRRGNHDPSQPNSAETGEFGFEDSINPSSFTWAKDNTLNGGEDFNENGTLETYGEVPDPLALPFGANHMPPFDASARPWGTLPRQYSGRGRMARQVLFRRALKIVNGGMSGASNSLPNGFTVASENPVYIHGNFNATSTNVTAEPNMPAAVIADAITLLSNAWNDEISFRYPNDETNRNASDTGYRFAMITGKAIPFAKPSGWGVSELGSDGGVHNFMRMLEDWGGRTLRYRGSMVSLFFSRQAIGIYRADANTYGAPTRGYNFDSDFLTPALLPPGTPMFRDVNTLKFRQILRPNQ
ncbi:MAG: hypothetical protein AB7O28_01795 [Vicinamibacterales bacterium]